MSDDTTDPQDESTDDEAAALAVTSEHMTSIIEQPDRDIELQTANDPTSTAAVFIERTYYHPEHCTLLYTDGFFYRWNSKHWEIVSKESLEAQISRMLRRATVPGDDIPQPFPLNNKTLDNVMRALRNLVITDKSPRLNTWLDEFPEAPDPKDLIVLDNVMLDVSTRRCYQHTPLFFGVHAATFRYDPKATAHYTMRWLNEALENDEQRVGLALEWMGYILTNDISKQKMLSAIGPPGAGKGTFIRLCQALVGKPNVAAPDMVSLGGSFGLEHASSKQLITIGDVQTLGRNAAEALSRLVAITGADEVEVNVKNKSSYITTMPGRVMTASNRVPALPDRDGALQRRMLVLKYRKSFVAKQDAGIEKRIHEELSGILNVSLAALDRMRERGNFVQPLIGTEELADLEMGAAPELEFALECCMIEPEARVSKEDLYEAWSGWARLYGFERRKITGLIRSLRSKYPELDARQKTLPSDGPVRPAVKGIDLTQDARTRFITPPIPGSL